MKTKQKHIPSKWALVMIFGIFFLTNTSTTITVLIYLFLQFILPELSILDYSTVQSVPFLLITFGIINLLFSFFYTTLMYLYMIKPTFNINLALDKITAGQYDTRVKIGKAFFMTKKIAKRFNIMANRLSSVDTMKNDFISNISHELKTPLAAIEGYSNLLADEITSREEREKYIQIIKKNAEHLASLSDDILMITKFDNNENVTNNEVFSLDEQIRQCIIFTEPKWQKKHIDFDLELEPININASKSIIQHIWYNLISNAIKFSNDDSVISISAFKENCDVKVVVSDNGCGMTEDTQMHIFEKFYQADSSRHVDGNGLGLALVKKILDMYKSEITVESFPGEGSTFIVTLKNML